MELRAYDVVVKLSVGKSRNYQKLRIRYVTVTSCVSWARVKQLLRTRLIRVKMTFHLKNLWI